MLFDLCHYVRIDAVHIPRIHRCIWLHKIEMSCDDKRTIDKTDRDQEQDIEPEQLIAIPLLHATHRLKMRLGSSTRDWLISSGSIGALAARLANKVKSRQTTRVTFMMACSQGMRIRLPKGRRAEFLSSHKI